ncbi:uncharacterized protein LOC132393697 isoform X2 [Hypanus sabinus]|uniref:uncharacterized protein LOC132393697 isoform X2 n=2 Tax=Hypanus sabinus TaxID=79690 RepID=UPI0028C4F41C|nr:uncharacterized protein LOC132393697 isoform X2 [Hypanus sabinus]
MEPEQIRCNVQCYGRGEVHEKIVKELDISKCKEPGILCVLFVYKESDESEDIERAVQWVTGEGRARQEDICAVILLVSFRDVAEEMKRTDPESFPEGTELMVVTNPGSVKNPQDGVSPSVPSEGTSDLNRGGGSSERLRCNVQCYGRGDVHEKIVNELHIFPCEEPVPCVLFVYKVSREIQDFQNALQWVTESQSVKSEDICAVVLLELSLDKWNKPVEVAHQGVFDDNTVVVRINGIQEGPKNREAKERIKQSIMDCQKKQRVKKDNWIVILSEKSLDEVRKPVEVAHQGMFDANTVNVRILYNSPDEIQEVPSNVEAMNKVRQSIRKCHVGIRAQF